MKNQKLAPLILGFAPQKKVTLNYHLHMNKIIFAKVSQVAKALHNLT